MDYSLYLLTELLYGAALLTAITAAPDILVKLRVSSQQESTVAFRYPEIWLTIIKALLFTALAMLPTVVKLPKFLTSHGFFKFLHLAPWILVCSFKFLRNVLVHLTVIRQVGQFNDSTGLIMALVIYCIFLVKASEMMLHWIAIVHLTTEGNILDVRTELRYIDKFCR